MSHLIDHTSANMDCVRLEKLCLPIDIPAIVGIPLCTIGIADGWAWNFLKSGMFTVISAYRMMIDTKMRRGA